MAIEYTITVPATITTTIVKSDDAPPPTATEVADAVGRHASLKNGQDFDTDTFEVINSEPVDDSQLPDQG
jgi:hypothetical protein